MASDSRLLPSIATQHPPSPITLGATRMRDAHGYTGTIVYYGPVASSKDASKLYYGVVWDDSNRGKHNGSVVCRATNRLVQHFHCEHATGASFVTTVDTGRELTPELLLERYPRVNEKNSQTADQEEQHVVLTSSGRTKPIDFVGRDKILQQQQLDKLRQISMRSMGISCVPECLKTSSSRNVADVEGDRSSADRSFISVQHFDQLDLAGNLLFDWADVQRLLQHFGNLRHLSLACNRLRLDTTHWLAEATHRFDRMVHLNIRGGVVDSWKTVQHLLRVLPNLQELCCAANDLSDLGTIALDETDMLESHERESATSVVVAPSMSWLDVSQCHLGERHIIVLAKHFPHLQWLSLDDNSIAKWPTHASLPRLQHLQIANNAINDWSVLEPINFALPKLQSLRLRRCPLLNDLGELQTRSIVIARFPSLTKFNASSISAQERQDAERHYLLTTSRRIHYAMSSASTPTNDSTTDGNSSFRKSIQDKELAKHPQYTRLLDKYPDLASRIGSGSHGNNENSSKHPNSQGMLLADTMVSVQIRSMAAQSCTMDPLLRRLPNQLTVGRLKALCSRHFGLPVDLQNLMLRASSSASIPEPMDENDRSLEYYGVSDGAEILVHEVDEQQLELQNRRAAAERERRMEEQQAQMEQYKKIKDMATRQ